MAAKKASKTTAKKARSAARAQGGARGGGDDLKVEQVRELVNLMVANELTSLEIVNGDLKVALNRGVPPTAAPMAVMAPAAAPAAASAPQAPVPAEPAPAEEGLLEIVSPMVGTFYAAPSPDSEPYVTSGSKVSPDTVICIVEAMKVMNEIKAECAGTIVELAVQNGQPVEYGQVLFRVRP